ncbi:MAG: tripartite tricarboxylate transporter permease [Desulfuromonadales bacterium]
MFHMLLTGFETVLTDPTCITMVFFGTLVGIIFGALPGLTVVAGLSMFLPVTYVMASHIGLSMLTGIYIGGTSGGLIAAILLNIPGTPNSIATCFEGVPMARKGQAGKALGLAVFASLIGTLAGVAVMIFAAPLLAKITLKFGPWEYFSVTLFALTLIAALTEKSVVKGLLSAMFGMMFATIGFSPTDGTPRYTFGSLELSSGFHLLVVLVGLYAIREVLLAASEKGQKIKVPEYKMKGFGFGLKDLAGNWVNLIRSTLVGLGIGVLPGIGGATSNLIAYSVAKNTSKHPEKYGTGIPDGIIASESSNNASIGGAMIPLLTLGIPGDGATAILLGGFLLHGMQPGPLLFEQNGPVVYSIFAAMALSAIIMAALMWGGMRVFVKILRVPTHILIPLIVVLCSIGAYALGNRVFDMWGLLLFGFVGLMMNRFGIPIPPFILGFILQGAMEVNLRRGLEYSNGNWMDAFTHPISAMFLVLTILSLILTLINNHKAAKRELAQGVKIS